MKRIYITIPVIILLTVSSIAVSQTSKWKTLFNGNDLDGWEVVGDIEVTVEDGALVINTKKSSEGGWLLNENSYDNFELKADFQLGPGSNSGIAIRYNELMGGHPAVTSYEINLDHNPDQQNPTGSIYNIARARQLNSLSFEGWKNIRIKAQGDHLQVLINDTLVAETHSRRAFVGRIGLQGHGGQDSQVKFKNVQISLIQTNNYLGPQIEDYLRSSVKRSLVPLFDGETLNQWHIQGDGVWEVRDGAIYGKAGQENAWLVSDSLYQDFYLKFKFKIAKEENSGVFIRNSSTDGTIGLETGLECNIYDHNGFSHVYSTGSIVTHARAWSNLVDFDDWNTMEIFAFGDQVTLYVNGLKASERNFGKSFIQQGNICLQAGTRVFTDRGPSEVWFKDIVIKNMDGIPYLGF